MENLNSLYKRFDDNINYCKVIREKIRSTKDNQEYRMLLDETYDYIKMQLPSYNCGESVHLLCESLAKEIKFTEGYVPENYFITDFKPNFNYENASLAFPKEKDADQILKWLVNYVWRSYVRKIGFSYSRNLDNASFYNRCTNFAEEISLLCASQNIPCYRVRINPGFSDRNNLYNGYKYHELCIIELFGNYYLVDPSYRQFFMTRFTSMKRIGIPYLDGTKPGSFMLLNESRLSLSQKLIENGYIQLDESTAKDYFDGFALSFRNGLYYSTTKDYSYETPYTAKDYENFLSGYDSQINHEGKEVLSLQRKL